MNKLCYDEMVYNLNKIITTINVETSRVVLFGHCNATEVLIDLLLKLNVNVECILDNNESKCGKTYRNIEIRQPYSILENTKDVVVMIAARAYAAMVEQLYNMGYNGPIYKMVEYNSFADYSLAEATVKRMRVRLNRGIEKLNKFKEKYKDQYMFLCPFSALGDIYIMMSYLPNFLKMHKIKEVVIFVVGKSCGEVVKIFGSYPVEVVCQQDMDEIIQATLHTGDKKIFIPHQDRPYVVNISKGLHVKKISLEQMYCCGVFGLPVNSKEYKPQNLKVYSDMKQVIKNKSVVLSPYAKSVTALDVNVWKEIVAVYTEQGYKCFTNVVGDEQAIEGTIPITASISEIQSIVEYAGIFIGIRSGLCDVLKYANCRKIALYPDYNYCNTHWKAIDIYAIDGWENIVVEDGFKWRIT